MTTALGSSNPKTTTPKAPITKKSTEQKKSKKTDSSELAELENEQSLLKQGIHESANWITKQVLEMKETARSITDLSEVATYLQGSLSKLSDNLTDGQANFKKTSTLTKESSAKLRQKIKSSTLSARKTTGTLKETLAQKRANNIRLTDVPVQEMQDLSVNMGTMQAVGLVAKVVNAVTEPVVSYVAKTVHETGSNCLKFVRFNVEVATAISDACGDKETTDYLVSVSETLKKDQKSFDNIPKILFQKISTFLKPLFTMSDMEKKAYMGYGFSEHDLDRYAHDRGEVVLFGATVGALKILSKIVKLRLPTKNTQLTPYSTPKYRNATGNDGVTDLFPFEVNGKVVYMTMEERAALYPRIGFDGATAAKRAPPKLLPQFDIFSETPKSFFKSDAPFNPSEFITSKAITKMVVESQKESSPLATTLKELITDYTASFIEDLPSSFSTLSLSKTLSIKAMVSNELTDYLNLQRLATLQLYNFGIQPLPRETLIQVIERVGRVTETDAGIKELVDLSHQMGLIYGELHGKTAPMEQPIWNSQAEWILELEELDNLIKECNFKISIAGQKVDLLYIRDFPFSELPNLNIAPFKSHLSYQVGDKVLTNVMLDHQLSQLGVSNLEFLLDSLDLQGVPTNLAIKDYYTFLSLLENELFLTIDQREQILTAFKRGYEFENPTTISPIVDLFYRLKNSLSSLKLKIDDKTLLQKYRRQVRANIGKINVYIHELESLVSKEPTIARFNSLDNTVETILQHQKKKNLEVESLSCLLEDFDYSDKSFYYSYRNPSFPNVRTKTKIPDRYTTQTVVSIHLFGKLNLEHFQIPQIKECNNYFITQTYLGESLDKVIKRMKKQTDAIQEGAEEFSNICYQMGVAFGELHSKTACGEKSIWNSSSAFLDELHEINFAIERTASYVNQNIARFKDIESLTIKEIDLSNIENFDVSPFTTAVSYQIGDLSISNFSWDSSSSRIGILDFDFCLEYFNVNGTPINIALDDYFIFLSELNTETYSFLTIEQRKLLASSFKEGYKSQNPLKIPKILELVYLIKNSIDLLESQIRNKKFIKTHAEEVKNNVIKTNEYIAQLEQYIQNSFQERKWVNRKFTSLQEAASTIVEFQKSKNPQAKTLVELIEDFNNSKRNYQYINPSFPTNLTTLKKTPDLSSTIALVSIAFIKNLNLQHFQIPQIKKCNNTSIRQNSLGETVNEALTRIGALTNNRQVGSQELYDLCYQAGLAFGELHAKTAHMQVLAAPTILRLAHTLEGVNTTIKRLSSTTFADLEGIKEYRAHLFFQGEIAKLKQLNLSKLRELNINLFESHLSYLFGDIGLTNFGWNKTSAKIGFFDFDFFLDTIDLEGLPTRIGLEDCYGFLSQLESVGYPLGLTVEEVKQAAIEFKKGYQLTNPVEIPRIVDLFYMIKESATALDNLLEVKRFTPSYIKGLKNSIQTFNNYVVEFENLVDKLASESTSTHPLEFSSLESAAEYIVLSQKGINPTANTLGELVDSFNRSGDAFTYYNPLFPEKSSYAKPLTIDVATALVSIERLKRLNLGHFQIPEIHWCDNSDMAQTYLGSTIKKIFEYSQQLNYGGRQKMEKLLQIYQQVGVSFAELHIKTAYGEGKIWNSTTELQESLATFNDSITDLNHRLTSDAKSSLQIDAFLQNNVTFDITKATYPLSYQFGDVGIGNLSWQRKIAKIGIFDFDFLLRHLDVDGHPATIGLQDCHAFLAQLEDDGVLFGLKIEEIKALKLAFKKGYKSLNPTKIPPIVDLFYRIQYSLESLEWQLGDKNFVTKHMKELEYNVSEINRAIIKFNEILSRTKTKDKVLSCKIEWENPSIQEVPNSIIKDFITNEYKNCNSPNTPTWGYSVRKLYDKLPLQKKGNRLTPITEDVNSYVVKEGGQKAVREALSLEYLNKQQPLYLVFSEIVKFDKNGLVVRAIEGESLQEIMLKRNLVDSKAACFAVGKGLGEFYSQKLQQSSQVNPYSKDLSFESEKIYLMIKGINRFLNKTKNETIDIEIETLNWLYNRYKKSLKNISHVFPSLKVSEISMTPNGIAAISNTKGLMDSVDLENRGVGNVSISFYSFIRSLEKEAYLQHLGLAETSILTKSFEEGFREQFKGEHLFFSSTFDDIVISIEVLHSLVKVDYPRIKTYNCLLDVEYTLMVRRINKQISDLFDYLQIEKD